MIQGLTALAAGALLGSLVTFGIVRFEGAAPHQMRGRGPFYTNTVMQNGACNVTKEDGLPVPNPNPEFPHVIATAESPHYGLHVMVLGRDSKIYHKHQISPGQKGNWTSWKCLTPDLKKVPCTMMPHCGGYDNNPALAMQPVNGTLVAFIRQMDDLVPHELHLTNPKDPDSWSTPRGPTCLCNFPPCKGQTGCGVVKECDNLGVDCGKHPAESKEYYGWAPLFPTSELQLIPDTAKERLVLYFRGFDGHYYSSTQDVPGDTGKWGKDGLSAYFSGDSIIE